MRTQRRGFTLIELLVVVAIIAILAAILFPVFAQARESARVASCLSNSRQIAISIHMYAQDYDEEFPMGTYPSPRNWEVNMDQPVPGADCNLLVGGVRGGWAGFNPGDGGPNYSGCSYGREFYRTLMSIQLNPYIKNKNVWYCPSDKRYRPTTQFISQGLMSFHWFPNWVFNNGCPGNCARYPEGFIDLNGDAPSERVNRPAERIILAEYGVFGWDGGDATMDNCQAWTARRTNFNHSRGYNVIYFDGHAKTIPYGKKWTTIPASGWGIACRPQ